MEYLNLLKRDVNNYPDLYDYPRPKYKRFTRRSYLNQCISEIYYMKNYRAPIVDIAAVKDKNIIRDTLSMVVAPVKISAYQEAVERVKKRLFPNLRQKSRKIAKPLHKVTTSAESLYFKFQRHLIGRLHMQRNYLKQEIPYPQPRVCGIANLISENLAINASIQKISHQLIGEICRYRYDQQHAQRSKEEQRIYNYNNKTFQNIVRIIQQLKEVQTEQYNRDRLLANEKLFEASIRSMLYIRILMGLVIDS